MTAPAAGVEAPDEIAEVDELEDLEEDDEDGDDDARPAPLPSPAAVRPTSPGPRVVGQRAPAAPLPAVASAGPRRVGRIDPASARKGRPLRPGSTAAAFEPLDPEEAAIPFDRVPYVPADLRRVALMAGLMVVLIVIAAVIVTATVK
jgi:hypothetical protein